MDFIFVHVVVFVDELGLVRIDLLVMRRSTRLRFMHLVQLQISTWHIASLGYRLLRALQNR